MHAKNVKVILEAVEHEDNVCDEVETAGNFHILVTG